MFAASWVCRRCSRLAARPSLTAQLLRRASTGVFILLDTSHYSAQLTNPAVTSSSSLPPSVLQRARKLAVEHDQLSASLATDFDTKIAKRAGELSTVAAALKDYEIAK